MVPVLEDYESRLREFVDKGYAENPSITQPVLFLDVEGAADGANAWMVPWKRPPPAEWGTARVNENVMARLEVARTTFAGYVELWQNEVVLLQQYIEAASASHPPDVIAKWKAPLGDAQTMVEMWKANYDELAELIASFPPVDKSVTWQASSWGPFVAESRVL